MAVPQGTGVTVSVGLDPQESRGLPADWWLAASTPFGPLWWTPDNGWVRSAAPVASASRPLVGFTDFVVLTADSLPAGLYTFYFGVDDNTDGYPDLLRVLARARHEDAATSERSAVHSPATSSARISAAPCSRNRAAASFPTRSGSEGSPSQSA